MRRRRCRRLTWKWVRYIKSLGHEKVSTPAVSTGAVRDPADHRRARGQPDSQIDRRRRGRRRRKPGTHRIRRLQEKRASQKPRAPAGPLPTLCLRARFNGHSPRDSRRGFWRDVKGCCGPMDGAGAGSEIPLRGQRSGRAVTPSAARGAGRAPSRGLPRTRGACHPPCPRP